MVLESANCTECRSEIWHDDNYCQECGVRTSMLSQRDTQWRKAPSGPSWSREEREPMAPSWKKPESNWTSEPTPIRSFVQSASEQSISSQSVPVQPAAPTSTPVTPAVPKTETPKIETPKTETANTEVKPELKIEKEVPPVKPIAPIETKQVEPVVTKPEVKAPIESKLVESKAAPKVVDFEKIEEDVDDAILKARWTALESPLLRPRLSDDVQNRRSPEEVVHKIKITNILWLCVCFLAGILIYCLFDIVKMTILKPETTAAKQTIVVPAAPTAPQESKAVEAPATEPVAETKLPEPAKTIVPVKSISVHPATVVPVVKPAKPVSPLAPAKVQAKPVAKAAPAKPAIVKPRPVHSAVAPEFVQPKSTSDASNARARTVWQAPSTAIKAQPVATPAAKPSHVVTSKGNGTDLTRYNRLLADYFSRAGNGSFGDESSEPPTYTEWLGRGKPEF